MTVTGTTQDINFNTTNFVQGSLLTRSGNRVLIGAGVTKVRVTYALMGESASGSSYLYGGIQRNTSRRTMQISPIISGQFGAISESSIIEVAAGDTIAIVADAGTGTMLLGTSRQSHFEVEVIA